MTRTLPTRLVLIAMLTAGAFATEATFAAASTPDRVAASTAGKKKAKKPTVKLGETTFGKVLVAADGSTLYAFDPDGGDINASTCTGGCASTWPPLEATKAKAGKGLDKSQLVVGESGQVAYAGHLLYKYAGDEAPGDTNGQGVGGVWHLVNAEGDTITA